MYMWNEVQDLHGKNNIQQEDNSFHQQNGLKYVQCWNLDTLESKSKIPVKFWNMVPVKGGNHADG